MWVASPTPFVEEAILVGTLVEDHLTMYIRIYFWALYSVPLVSISAFMPVIYYLITITLLYVLKSGSMWPLPLFFLKIALAILGPLKFHVICKILFLFLKKKKKAIRILEGIALNL